MRHPEHLRCQCTGVRVPDEIPCQNKMTAEDLQCDGCRYRCSGDWGTWVACWLTPLTLDESHLSPEQICEAVHGGLTVHVATIPEDAGHKMQDEIREEPVWPIWMYGRDHNQLNF